MDWKSHGSAWCHHLFLLEASGDSEGDGDSCLEYYSEANLQSLGGFSLINSEDDAESCSCGYINDERGGEDFQDENGTVVDEVTKVEEMHLEEAQSISIGGVHGSRMMTEDQMEGDRLFWETCLEAGYP